MQVQIVEFELRGIARADYEAHCEAVAPKFAQMPGLVSKTWIADPEGNRAGGVYTWESAAAREAYEASEVFAALQADPALANVRTRHFDVLDGPSRVTAAGRAVPAAA